MSDGLRDFIQQIKDDKRFASFDEAAVKQGVVLRILSFLGWDPFNMEEIHPGFDVKGGRVDFSLRYNDINKVFIQVKKGVKNFKKFQGQLTDYAVQEDVKLSALTDGISWWFSLPLQDGGQDEKKFHTINIEEQQVEDITQNFVDLLSKENVISDRAFETAEDIYNQRLSSILIIDTLPKAWNKIMSEPERWLYDILAEVTNDLCGHKPDTETVEKFIALELDTNSGLAGIFKPKMASLFKKNKKTAQIADYTEQSIEAFAFLGAEYKVKSWDEMLLKLCEIIARKHRDDFESVLTLTGEHQGSFSTNQYELLTSAKIPGTELYVNADLDATVVMALAYEILELFGYEESDLTMDTT
jgi:predicted type IV restriction endonuclease